MSAETLKLGSYIEGEQHRDAVHIAVAPVVLDVESTPGDHVGFVEGSTELVTRTAKTKIGIVDPFLSACVLKKGARVWLFLYPGSITSLRHEWTHPAFAKTNKEKSQEWMREWAKRQDMPYDLAIRAGHELSVFNYEDARYDIDNEWWAHWEAITGEKGQRGEFFSCAC
jgi:hypothetical protein